MVKQIVIVVLVLNVAKLSFILNVQNPKQEINTVFNIEYSDQFDGCAFQATVRIPEGCGQQDTGLSGGAIFLIIVFTAFIAYLIIGTLINVFYFKIKALPQQAFWASLPGFFILGIKVTYRSIASRITGKSAPTSPSPSSSDGYVNV
eukprot:UN01587